jgi:hypothetical protein
MICFITESKEANASFCEQKAWPAAKQKNFDMLAMGVTAATAYGPEDQKLFGSFFQKRTASFFSHSLPHPRGLHCIAKR